MSYLPTLFKYVDEHQDEYVQVNITVDSLFKSSHEVYWLLNISDAWRLTCASNPSALGTESSLIELVLFFNSCLLKKQNEE